MSSRQTAAHARHPLRRFVALSLAIQKLVKAGTVAPSVIDTGRSCFRWHRQGEGFLDLCYEEDSTAEVDFNIS